MISTGIQGLDEVLTGLQLGDNVVWQINDIHHYADFVAPFAKKALEDKRKLVYIRFANHPPLLESHPSLVIHKLDATAGFESFSSKLYRIIKKEGEGVFYVFDCLSDLLSAWSNDLMIGNFFKITCPFLFDLRTIAYFSLLRNSHSFKTVARIRDTTQILIDAHEHNGHDYIHPLKVWNRYSPTMFLPHIQRGNRYIPIASSIDTARLFSSIFKSGAKSAERKLDYWDRLFLDAEDLAGQKPAPDKTQDMVDQLCRIVIARDGKMLDLAKTHLKLDDFLNIKARMIGTGLIGGKSVGMLIARNIVLNEKSLKADQLLEPHDSFYVGSDVFYTYMVENGLWQARMEQRTKKGYFTAARPLKEKLLKGVFPEEIKEQFLQMIEYFGQSPIIVRSSSLLEDSYGNAFAGKYESIFLVNQGTPEERYGRFVDAVRRIYASTMNEEALVYRQQRGLDQMDEQMALLVQRVSGSYHQDYFFPDGAGVGISYNAFVWKKTLDPKAGMLRLVVGLGTRAVNRVEGDYPRIVALDEPLLKAHGGPKDVQKFSQHDVDVLNVKENIPQTLSLRELLKKKVDLQLDLIAVHQPGDDEIWTVTFDDLLSRTPFRPTMQQILQTLEQAYQYPVDIEFTFNFTKSGDFQVNLLQCRPMQTKGLGQRVEFPKPVAKEKILFQSEGNFLGGNMSQAVDRIIYIDPKGYFNLASQSDKYAIARAIGELNRQIPSREQMSVMLLGPGRWGTSTPSLGVPVSFAEINNMTILGEIAYADNHTAPEISYGTHFFQDLVETDIFYLALFPENRGVYIDRKFFDAMTGRLKTAGAASGKLKDVIKVFDVKDQDLRIVSDILTQKVICYFR